MNEDMKMVLTAPSVVCPKCGGKFFKEVYVLKRISPIISPTGEEETIEEEPKSKSSIIMP